MQRCLNAMSAPKHHWLWNVVWMLFGLTAGWCIHHRSNKCLSFYSPQRRKDRKESIQWNYCLLCVLCSELRSAVYVLVQYTCTNRIINIVQSFFRKKILEAQTTCLFIARQSKFWKLLLTDYFKPLGQRLDINKRIWKFYPFLAWPCQESYCVSSGDPCCGCSHRLLSFFQYRDKSSPAVHCNRFSFSGKRSLVWDWRVANPLFSGQQLCQSPARWHP